MTRLPCLAPALPLSLVLALAASAGAAAASAPTDAKIESIDQLWAGFDPRAVPLEIERIESKDEDDVHIDTIYFTGEVFEGQKTRVFGYLGRPRRAAGRMPALLHIHGGGQTANRDWPRFWAKRGYVCLSFDFCGNTNLPTLGPEYRRQRYTLWGKVPADMMTVGGGTKMTPTPRWNPWYHWTLAARRGLTLLEQQSDVDPARMGIFGISVGGTLTWIVAGVDDRVRVAAPIYGCGWESYQYPIQLKPSVDEEKRLWRRLIAPETHAPRIRCPVMLFSASDDFHGKMDLAFRTLDALAAPIRSQGSQVFTANYDHHVEAAEARSLPLWMDVHLKGLKGSGLNPWPGEPRIEWLGGQPVPRLRVTPQQPGEVRQVDLYYCLSNDWPRTRFWRTVEGSVREGESTVGPAPYVDPSETLYAYANVTYRSGVRISSRMAIVPAAKLPGVLPTLVRQPLIDAMDTSRDWSWVPAFTDPNQGDVVFFAPWSDGSLRGFTLDPTMFPRRYPMPYYFGTRKIGDPQFRGRGEATLAIDILHAHLPEKLTVRLEWRTPGMYGEQYSYNATPTLAQSPPGDAWLTLRLRREQFSSAQGKPLADWEHVEHFMLDGANSAGKPPVFRRLRWE